MMFRRFLQADKFDVEKASARYREACEMREKTHLLELYESIATEDFEKARVLVSFVPVGEGHN